MIRRITLTVAAVFMIATTALAQKGRYDVYLLIGQSNMAGRGKMIPEDKIPYKGIYVLDSLDKAVPAAAPLNQFSTIRKDISMQGYNIGNSFAEAIHARTGRRVLLVVNAKGGTAIEEWLEDAPEGKNQPQFYSEAVRRTKKAMKYGELKAILWHQGEANASKEKAAKYLDQLSGLVAGLRRDLGDVPFIACEINDSDKGKFNPVINRISEVIPDSYCIKAEDCPMNSDNLHFSREGLVILGHRYADTVYKAVYQK